MTTMKRVTITPVVEITAAGPKDVPAITALLRAADLPDQDFADHLEHFLVARRAGEVVGAIGFELHGADALLRSLVVALELRGAGLGGRLVEQLTAAAQARGVKRFFLLTMTAEAFFAKRGFQKADRRSVPAAIAGTKEFNSLCPVSAICMTRAVEAAIVP
jgi:amino-acid N-acetyltransferase